MATQTTRINWIDWAKLFGIFLVVLGHVYDYCDLTIYVYSFHMPLFFALSGLTFKQRTIREEIIVSTKRILIPYLFFMAIGYVSWITKALLIYPERLYPNIIINGGLKPLLGVLLGVAQDTSFSSCVNIPLWFLPALFCTRVICSFLENLCSKKQLSTTNRNLLYFSVITIFAVISVALQNVNFILPFSLRSVFMVFAFFVAAFLLKDKILNLHKSNAIYRLIIAIVLFTALIFLSNTNGRVNVSGVNFGKYAPLFYINASIGTSAFLLICSLFSFPQKRAFATLGRNTITILGVHAIILNTVIVLIAKTFAGNIALHGPQAVKEFVAIGYPYYSLMLLAAFITIIICLIPCYICERWLPQYIGKK